MVLERPFDINFDHCCEPAGSSLPQNQFEQVAPKRVVDYIGNLFGIGDMIPNNVMQYVILALIVFISYLIITWFVRLIVSLMWPLGMLFLLMYVIPTIRNNREQMWPEFFNLIKDIGTNLVSCVEDLLSSLRSRNYT